MVKWKTPSIWFIFPQLSQLGNSATSRTYGIKDLPEVAAFLSDDTLGNNLSHTCQVLLSLSVDSLAAVFTKPDCIKVHACITLFSQVEQADPVFKNLINRFFGGVYEPRTMAILNAKTL